MKLLAELETKNTKVGIDNREQGDVPPWDMAPLPWEWTTLQTGDFQLLNLPGVAVVERKTLPDFIQCVGRERARFERELERMRAFEHRIVIVEADFSALQTQTWRGQITPAQAIGSVCGWMGQVGFLFAGSREAAGDACKRFLYTAARREWRKLRALAGGVLETVETRETEVTAT